MARISRMPGKIMENLGNHEISAAAKASAVAEALWRDKVARQAANPKARNQQIQT
jgi:hypothetical protein